MEPINVTVIGTGPGSLPRSEVMIPAMTPEGLPNLRIDVVRPLVAMSIRFGHIYLTILVGLVTAGITPKGAEILMPVGDFRDLLWNCSLLAISGAVVDLLKNLVTIFGRLENKYPFLTGNV